MSYNPLSTPETIRRDRRDELTERIEELDESISQLLELRNRLAKERDAETQRLTNPPGTGKRIGGGTSDTLAVPAADLIFVMKRWVQEYGEGGIGMLATKSGTDAGRIRRILKGEYKFITLTIADILLTAMNMEHLLEDKVKVVPNPYRTVNVERDGSGT